jgi:hypothetical protein
MEEHNTEQPTYSAAEIAKLLETVKATLANQQAATPSQEEIAAQVAADRAQQDICTYDGQ